MEPNTVVNFSCCLFFQVLDIYDSQLGMVRIGPFNYDPLRGVNLWLSQSDEFLLNHLSTSPEVEPPHFVMQVRWKYYIFREGSRKLILNS